MLIMIFLATTYSATSFVFFFNDTATTEIYTLSLHDALPSLPFHRGSARSRQLPGRSAFFTALVRSEEHTSELQSRFDLVCRLLLEKKKITYTYLSPVHATLHLIFCLSALLSPIHLYICAPVR